MVNFRRVKLCQALEIADKIWTGSFSFKADIYNNLGLVYRSLGDYEKSEELYYHTLHIRENIYPARHPLILAIQSNIAQVFASHERYEDAIVLFETVIQDYNENLSAKTEEDSSFLATVYDNLSMVYRSAGRYEDALLACTKGLNMRENIYGRQSVDYALSLNDLALIYYEKGALDDSLNLFRDALEIKKKLLPAVHGQISVGYFNLGLVYDKLH